MLVFVLAALAATEPAVSDRPASPGHSLDHQKARDGEVAIREEFELAARAGTVAAWTLFIERHPGHPLVPAAEAERRKLMGAKP